MHDTVRTGFFDKFVYVEYETCVKDEQTIEDIKLIDIYEQNTKTASPLFQPSIDILPPAAH